MARPLRLEFPGALYHITSRGDRREPIYEDDQDRLQWLDILSKACERYNWRVHAYCLMDNHYHVLLETADGNLSKGMRHLNGVYTQYFNRQHNRVGHVFQGRFKAILVEKEAYLLELSRYIVLNPIRARMINDMEKWEWSSYRATIGKAQIPAWLETDWLLGHFGRRRKRARERYIDFVRQGIGLPSIWENLRKQIFLGGEAFVDQHLEKIAEKADLDEIPALQRSAMSKPISNYQDKYKDENIAIKEAYLSGGHTMKEIGRHFGKHYTTISRIIKRHE
ncbi:MAG: transposase [Gammaproteobacteria bacterium]